MATTDDYFSRSLIGEIISDGLHLQFLKYDRTVDFILLLQFKLLRMPPCKYGRKFLLANMTILFLPCCRYYG